MRYKNILFDLDGTLTDSAEGIIKSLSYALGRFGANPPAEQLYRFIGPPLTECFSEYLGDELTEQAVAVYRERYSKIGIFENRVYDGVAEMLAAVKAAGLRTALATSKPEVYARRILEHFGLSEYFDVVAGASLDGHLSSKAAVIELALSRIEGARREETVIVGDRLHDMEGARACSIGAVAALWGFGSYEELSSYNPLYLAKTPLDAAEYLTK